MLGALLLNVLHFRGELIWSQLDHARVMAGVIADLKPGHREGPLIWSHVM